MLGVKAAQGLDSKVCPWSMCPAAVFNSMGCFSRPRRVTQACTGLGCTYWVMALGVSVRAGLSAAWNAQWHCLLHRSSLWWLVRSRWHATGACTCSGRMASECAGTQQHTAQHGAGSTRALQWAGTLGCPVADCRNLCREKRGENKNSCAYHCVVSTRPLLLM